jgi:hypothetical protein
MFGDWVSGYLSRLVGERGLATTYDVELSSRAAAADADLVASTRDRRSRVFDLDEPTVDEHAMPGG